MRRKQPLLNNNISKIPRRQIREGILKGAREKVQLTNKIDRNSSDLIGGTL
jgi:hypothetical protein